METTRCWIGRVTRATAPAGAAGSSAGYAACRIAIVSAFAGATPAKLAVARAPCADGAALVAGMPAVAVAAGVFASADWISAASCFASCAETASQMPIGTMRAMATPAKRAKSFRRTLCSAGSAGEAG